MVIGVTGSFGSGKSTVAAMFKRRGARVLDCDLVVRRLLEANARCHRGIRRVFGAGFMTPRGVDRARLAAEVFRSPVRLRALERIIHPLAWDVVKKDLEKKGTEGLVVVDAPLLIEAGWYRKVDAVIVVRAGINEQIRRIQRKTAMERRDILLRLKRQMPFGQKIKFADFVVDNRGLRSDTYRQVRKIMDHLKQSSVKRRTGSCRESQKRRTASMVRI